MSMHDMDLTPMENTRILLIVNEDAAKNAYAEILDKVGVAYNTVTSFSDASSMARNTAYNGLLVDVMTLIRADQNERNIALECMNCYPSTQIKWDAKNKTVRSLTFLQTLYPESESAFRMFIEERCKPFSARTLRIFNRESIVMSLLFSIDCDCSDEKALKTFLINLSLGGCFIHAVQTLYKGQEVWLRLLELSDPTPIKAVVRWQREWNTKRQIPGIGVKFELLSEIQKKQIDIILGE